MYEFILNKLLYINVLFCILILKNLNQHDDRFLYPEPLLIG